MKVFNCILLIFVSNCQGDFGTLWKNFKEVARLGELVAQMDILLRDGNKDMVELKDYLKRNETRQIATCLRNSIEYIGFYTFLVDNGMPLENIFKWINEQLEWGEYIPPTLPEDQDFIISKEIEVSDNYQPVRTAGKLKDLKQLWDELVAIIPTDELLSWYLEMLVVNPDMQKLMAQVRRQNTIAIRDQLHQCEAYLDYRCHFINAGIDLTNIEKQACDLFGWEGKCGIYEEDTKNCKATTTSTTTTTTTTPTTTTSETITTTTSTTTTTTSTTTTTTSTTTKTSSTTRTSTTTTTTTTTPSVTTSNTTTIPTKTSTSTTPASSTTSTGSTTITTTEITSTTTETTASTETTTTTKTVETVTPITTSSTLIST